MTEKQNSILSNLLKYSTKTMTHYEANDNVLGENTADKNPVQRHQNLFFFSLDFRVQPGALRKGDVRQQFWY